MQDYAPQIFSAYISSNSGIKKAIKRGRILTNGKPASTGTWITEGALIELLNTEKSLPKIYQMQLDVIFEDEHFAAINKPAGISVSGNNFRNIYNALPYNLKKSTAIDALSWPTPVHRLDNPTSGILLIAKTKTAQIELGNQFKNKTIQKKYCVIVTGNVTQNRIIDIPIENKEAETAFDVIRVSKSVKYGYLTCLKAYPKTGRTHQIRIHLASIGHPILGDKLYWDNPNIKHSKGLFLSATEVEFNHPKSYKKIHLKLDVPRKFKSFLVREKRIWNTVNK
ncbi:MAG TPA: RluA family pseudouridine synthase [Flavobacteriaceae bacterium]|nr:RluA family pseudouridine synthase [Flavobacteriaceae bacterium]